MRRFSCVLSRANTIQACLPAYRNIIMARTFLPVLCMVVVLALALQQRASAMLPLTLDESEARWRHVRDTGGGRYCLLSVSALAGDPDAARCSLRWEEIEVSVSSRDQTHSTVDERVLRAVRNDTQCSTTDDTCASCTSHISSPPVAQVSSLEDWYSYCRNVGLFMWWSSGMMMIDND